MFYHTFYHSHHIVLLIQYDALCSTHKHDHSQNMFYHMFYHSHNTVLLIRYGALCNTHKHDLLQGSFDRMRPFCTHEKEAAINKTESAEAQEQECTSARAQERESVCGCVRESRQPKNKSAPARTQERE